ncbi:unnamed protein product [Paramecium octaurelia]|uniref:Uncharacterized protein n=1 Tax=Paramecium octaurelia TaxID=43137 RepID=A0A8S1X381_PAROT|nr:unnamed protein product [Paramecium octaurelia]
METFAKGNGSTIRYKLIFLKAGKKQQFTSSKEKIIRILGFFLCSHKI